MKIKIDTELTKWYDKVKHSKLSKYTRKELKNLLDCLDKEQSNLEMQACSLVPAYYIDKKYYKLRVKILKQLSYAESQEILNTAGIKKKQVQKQKINNIDKQQLEKDIKQECLNKFSYKLKLSKIEDDNKQYQYQLENLTSERLDFTEPFFVNNTLKYEIQPFEIIKLNTLELLALSSKQEISLVFSNATIQVNNIDDAILNKANAITIKLMNNEANCNLCEYSRYKGLSITDGGNCEYCTKFNTHLEPKLIHIAEETEIEGSGTELEVEKTELEVERAVYADAVQPCIDCHSLQFKPF